MRKEKLMGMELPMNNCTNRYARTEEAFVELMDTFAGILVSQGFRFPEREMTLVDAGAGQMPYGAALERWALKRVNEVRLFAVDPVYADHVWRGLFCPNSLVAPSRKPIKQLPYKLEDTLRQFKSLGVGQIDLLTLFNPRPFDDLPQVKDLSELCKGTPIVGTLDEGSHGHSSDVQFQFVRQGYETQFYKNPITSLFRSSIEFAYAYDPLFIAMPK